MPAEATAVPLRLPRTESSAHAVVRVLEGGREEADGDGIRPAVFPRQGQPAQEAAEAARRIDPRVAVPMHWGENIGTYEDAQEFARRAPVEVEIMKPLTE